MISGSSQKVIQSPGSLNSGTTSLRTRWPLLLPVIVIVMYWLFGSPNEQRVTLGGDVQGSSEAADAEPVSAVGTEPRSSQRIIGSWALQASKKNRLPERPMGPGVGGLSARTPVALGEFIDPDSPDMPFEPGGYYGEFIDADAPASATAHQANDGDVWLGPALDADTFGDSTRERDTNATSVQLGEPLDASGDVMGFDQPWEASPVYIGSPLLAPE